MLPAFFLRAFFLLTGLWTLTTWAVAQAPAPTAPATPAAQAPKRQLRAVRISEAIKLDASLDEPAWQRAQPATGFIQNRPKPGPREKHPTEVRVLYDDANLYVGALMHDVSPDSILREMKARDTFGNSDFFGIFLDTYADKLNGYGFFVTPAGVQMDARYSPATGEDFHWNAVWDSRAALRGTDWVVEMRIPYSAIRFSTADVQTWGLQFMRMRQRDNAGFFWNEVKPELSGFVNQWGELLGVQGVKPPLRLSLTPYVSAYVNHNPLSPAGTRPTSTSLNGGADVKWGINESFTLDATLVPDFGQVQSDNQVLNLTPFEVQFNENRQFFTEGTELFNKGNLFYSRRVGATPMGYHAAGSQLRSGEKLLANPAETQLLNATKVSGRTSQGLGIGVFNALSRSMHATVRNADTGQEREVLTQPFSNYSIVVLDQSLKNNSFLSLVNTNVTRAGRTYDANVTGGLFRFNDRKNAYSFNGSVVYSRRRGTQFGSEQAVADRDGYKYALGYGKISGTWKWGLHHGIESDTYNPNDLGILFGNNNITQSVDFGYHRYQPFWKVNNFHIFGQLSHSMLYRPTRYQSLKAYLGANTVFTKSFLQVGFDLNVDPTSHNYFEPRVTPLGKYFVRVPGSSNLVLFFNSDNRKAFALGMNAGLRYSRLDERLPRARYLGYRLGVYPRYRVNDRLTFRYSLDWSLAQNQVGYVNGGLSAAEALDRPLIQALGGDTLSGRGPADVLLGGRHVATVANVLSAAYTFTNRMSFTLRVRHYSSNVRYNEFARLRPGGEEQAVAYARNRDNTYNAFNLDAVYSWWFAPGSQVSVVWKNAGSTFLQAEEATPLYFDNLSNTINTPHNNSLSVKVIYYLDYLDLKRR